MRAIAPALRRFWRSETAALSVEFVLLFPLMLFAFLLLVFTSLYFSAASDLQQVVHELARYSFRFIGQDAEADICGALRGSALPVLLDGTLTLRPAQFTLQSCSMTAGPPRMITITGQYDFGGSMLQSLGRNFGIDLGQITRSSHFIL